MRVVLLLMTMLANSCAVPQRILAMELSREDYSVAVRCMDPRAQLKCIDATWEANQYLSEHLDCELDSDCIVLAEFDPIEIPRTTVNKRIEGDLLRVRSELSAACGDWDWFWRGHLEAQCRDHRCALTTRLESALLLNGCAKTN